MAICETFACPLDLYQDLIASTINRLTLEDYKHQQIATEEGDILVQIEKRAD